MVLLYEIVVFIVFLVAVALLFTRCKWFQLKKISPFLLFAFFLIKVAAGLLLAYNYFEVKLGANDYYEYNNLSIVEYEFLKATPFEWLQEWFMPRYGGFGNVFGSNKSYWNDFAENLLIKPLSVFNYITHGNFYLNTIPFLFFGFLGSIGFYKLFNRLFPELKWPAILASFFLPSTFLFTASMHKDTLCFGLLGLFCYYFYRILHNEKVFRSTIIAGLSLLFIFLFRNHIAAIIIVFGVITLIVRNSKENILKPFVILTALGLIITVIISLISPRLSPAAIIAKKQIEFLERHPESGTGIVSEKMEENLSSVLKFTPQAFVNGFLRPFPTDCKYGKVMIFFFAELYLYLFLIFLFFKNKHLLRKEPILYFALFACFFMFLITGYTTPNLATIIRYKSIFLPLFILPFSTIFIKKEFIL